MREEKRKYTRSECVLPAEVIKIEGKDHISIRTTAHDLSDEGLKLTVNLNLDPGSTVDLKLYLPEKKLSTLLSGEIIRVKSIDKKLEVGLRIKEIDGKLKSELLSWVFPKWQGTKAEKKKGKKVS
jgi:c-di-GMP-binding flagellar brake protein YcgR